MYISLDTLSGSGNASKHPNDSSTWLREVVLYVMGGNLMVPSLENYGKQRKYRGKMDSVMMLHI